MKHSYCLVAIAAGAAALSVAQGALAREYVEGQAPAYVEPAHRQVPPHHAVATGWHGDRYWDGHRWWERQEWNKRHHHHDDNYHDDDHHH